MLQQFNKKLKITFIIDWLPSNRAGTERQLIYLIKGLPSSIFDIHLICLRDTEWINRNSSNFPCKVNVIKIYEFKKLSTYLNFIKLVLIIKKIEPDIVHTFFPTSNILGVIASKICVVSNVITSRRDYGDWITPKYLYFTKILNKFITKIITNSKNVKKFTSEIESIRPNKIDVIYNGIDIKRFSNMKEADDKLKLSLGIPEDGIVVGAVANLRPMKHLNCFILAASEVLKVRRDVHFLLVGRGPSRQELENLSRNLAIESNIHFAGSQEDIIPFLKLFDVAVNCSSQEGLSNAILEYMAAGVPCVVSDEGGNNELIENDVNGLLFELDNYKELSHKIMRLLEYKDISAQFALRAKEKANRHFSLSKMLDNYERYYISFVSRKQND